MKKLIAVLSIVLFVFVGCQESGSVIPPEKDSSLDKKQTAEQVVPETDDPGSQDSQDPSFPRI